MVKRRIIITQEQLNEIIGGAYLSDSNGNTDNKKGEEITASGTIEKPNGDIDIVPAKKTDDISGNMSRNLGAFSSYFGYRRMPVPLRERNSDLQNKSYQVTPTGEDNMMSTGLAKDSTGANAIKNGVKGQNLPVYAQRFREAKREAELGDPSKLNRMGGMAAANEIEGMYDKAKSQSQNLRNANGNHIKSVPKQSGNGQGHSTKTNNGIISFK